MLLTLKVYNDHEKLSHTSMVCIHTENQNQGSSYPFVLLKISVLHELPFGHLRYYLTNVPPQPNSPPDSVEDVNLNRSYLTLKYSKTNFI
ncbi:hypothetical protein CONCODRAFT_6177 [Conidiobolus coronatus NRRL 28638]|uniref:Uncharacterized protein n=1 Tax=Conidiobolus coronatus (strain ATCC 28846 / CBS 209.66 / NRRL 28638) TaxID=796925 RepID=A0A137P815_CONC2|nr:hypothetical protein CONCODRAFT_6177 [Conidiobolus coronatus NRRL 28638]|eukprot:KXN71153.1 hypothetical protein CONCODRAFT_6177 [Conidiobolus coronatus NRRL 28638]